MGLSLSDLNPVKAIKSGFNSITGISAQQDAINSASRSKRKSLEAALEALQKGDASAIKRLMEGRDTVLGAVNTGFDEGISSFGQIADLFNPEGIRQGLTLEGMGNTFNQILDPSGPFAGLIDARQADANTALSSAGLRRSGAAAEAAAEIPLEFALGLSDKLFNRNISNPALGAIGNIAQLQVNRGGAIGDIEGDLASSLAGIDLSGASNEANILTGQGAVDANQALALGQLDAQSTQGLTNLFGGQALQTIQGGGQDILGGILGGGGGGAMDIASLAGLIGMFSDERMKTNLEEVSRDGPFTFYQWDWKPEVLALDLPLMDVGLLAQDVQKIAPEYVHEIDIGANEKVLTIDYTGLFEDPRKWH